MTITFNKGVRRALIYYATGISVTVIAHLIAGWENKVLMPPSFVCIIFLSMISLPWACLNITDLNCSRKRPQSLGELFMHLLFFCFLAGFIVYIRN